MAFLLHCFVQKKTGKRLKKQKTNFFSFSSAGGISTPSQVLDLRAHLESPNLQFATAGGHKSLFPEKNPVTSVASSVAFIGDLRLQAVGCRMQTCSRQSLDRCFQRRCVNLHRPLLRVWFKLYRDQLIIYEASFLMLSFVNCRFGMSQRCTRYSIHKFIVHLPASLGIVVRSICSTTSQEKSSANQCINTCNYMLNARIHEVLQKQLFLCIVYCHFNIDT